MTTYNPMDETQWQDVHPAHKQDASWPATYCPLCRKYGKWRAGYEYDHEMRCPTCKIVWAPGDVLDYREVRAVRMQGLFGDGI